MPEETLTITVPDEALDWIRSQIQIGNFTSHEDAFRAGISLLRDEWEFERAMRSDEVAWAVAESYDEAKRSPESLIPAEEVMRDMEKRHTSRSKRAS